MALSSTQGKRCPQQYLVSSHFLLRIFPRQSKIIYDVTIFASLLLCFYGSFKQSVFAEGQQVVVAVAHDDAADLFLEHQGLGQGFCSAIVFPCVAS